MFVETNPIPIKTAAELMGLIPSGEFRLPLCSMSVDNLEKLKKALEDYSLWTAEETANQELR